MEEGRQAESQTEQEKQLLLLAAELSPAGMLAVDSDGVIVAANREIERLFGYERSELIGQPVEMLVPLKARSGHPSARAQYSKTPTTRPMGSNRHLHGVRKDGSEVPVEVGLNPVHSEQGFYVLSSVVDISARRAAEKQLRQAQKLEAIGTLASGIAHDFNNILLGIVGHTDLVLRGSALTPQDRLDLEQVMRAAERGRELVQRILTYSRRDEASRSAIAPDKPVLEALALLKATLPASIVLRHDVGTSVPSIAFEEGRLHQITMNLVTNAAHAIADRGFIEVSLEGVRLSKETATTSGQLPAGLYCRLRVRDNGHGMAPEIQSRAFDPFFSTKEPDRGTGLGLSTVLGIVQAQGGNLNLESEPGRGTTIDAYLPAIGSPRSEPAPDTARTRRILVVDDEPTLAQMTARAVSLLGYRTDVFSSSVEALDAFEQAPERFDLVITDNTMPKLSGIEMMTRMRARRPDLPVLVVSGLDALPDPHPARTGYLAKPFTISALEHALAKLDDEATR